MQRQVISGRRVEFAPDAGEPSGKSGQAPRERAGVGDVLAAHPGLLGVPALHVHRKFVNFGRIVDHQNAEILAVDEALKSLAKVDGRKSQVVELRFFGGLTVDETATVLKVSPETVIRDWRLAKAWLLRQLSGEGTHGS